MRPDAGPRSGGTCLGDAVPHGVRRHVRPGAHDLGEDGAVDVVQPADGLLGRHDFDRERQGRRVSVLVDCGVVVGGDGLPCAGRAGESVALGVEGQPRRQGGGQRVGQRSVAPLGRRQRQGIDRAAFHPTLRRNPGVAEGGDQVRVVVPYRADALLRSHRRDGRVGRGEPKDHRLVGFVAHVPDDHDVQGLHGLARGEGKGARRDLLVVGAGRRCARARVGVLHDHATTAGAVQREGEGQGPTPVVAFDDRRRVDGEGRGVVVVRDRADAGCAVLGTGCAVLGEFGVDGAGQRQHDRLGGLVEGVALDGHFDDVGSVARGEQQGAGRDRVVVAAQGGGARARVRVLHGDGLGRGCAERHREREGGRLAGRAFLGGGRVDREDRGVVVVRDRADAGCAVLGAGCAVLGEFGVDGVGQRQHDRFGGLVKGVALDRHFDEVDGVARGEHQHAGHHGVVVAARSGGARARVRVLHGDLLGRGPVQPHGEAHRCGLAGSAFRGRGRVDRQDRRAVVVQDRSRAPSGSFDLGVGRLAQLQHHCLVGLVDVVAQQRRFHGLARFPGGEGQRAGLGREVVAPRSGGADARVGVGHCDFLMAGRRQRDREHEGGRVVAVLPAACVALRCAGRVQGEEGDLVVEDCAGRLGRREECALGVAQDDHYGFVGFAGLVAGNSHVNRTDRVARGKGQRAGRQHRVVGARGCRAGAPVGVVHPDLLRARRKKHDRVRHCREAVVAFLDLGRIDAQRRGWGRVVVGDRACDRGSGQSRIGRAG